MLLWEQRDANIIMTSYFFTLKLRFQSQSYGKRKRYHAKQRSSSVVVCIRSALRKCNADNKEEIIHLDATEMHIELN